ncbi:MAG TPA: A/G-specific adenine glycosylase, partial [Solirubrobacteraceae bacterium]|nr:A/G-specific adenine glycosylase [Solirubrobacteraceae bacterium]
SFAWDRQEPAVDTNVRRVFERRDGVARGPAALTVRAREVMPAGRAATFNQAMMELGATVCRPRAPICGDCPVREGCAARDQRVSPRGMARRRAPRFEDTDRWARGRVVAALVNGEPVPAGERFERVLAGLERDGLITRAADGAPALPAS